MEEAYIGLKTDNGNIAPMFLFQNATGWGDGEPTSNKFSWVLHVKGTDDHSVYMLFGMKEGAINYAHEYITGDKVLDPWKDEFNGSVDSFRTGT